MKKKRNWGIVVLLLLLLGVFIWWGTSKQNKGPEQEEYEVELRRPNHQGDSASENTSQDTNKAPEVLKEVAYEEITKLEQSKNPSEEFEIEVQDTLNQKAKKSKTLDTTHVQNTIPKPSNLVEEQKIKSKIFEIKEIELICLSKIKQKVQFFNGGDEVLKGELYYVLKDNISDFNIQQSVITVEFDFFVSPDGSIVDYEFMGNVTMDLQSKIKQELKKIQDWNTDFISQTIRYKVKIFLV